LENSAQKRTGGEKKMQLSKFRLAKLTDIPADGELPDLSDLHWIPAQPGRAIHYDLMEAGLLKNPYSGNQAAVEAQQVTQSDWAYISEFGLNTSLMDSERLFLELR
jgi:hypothetical protein